MADWSLLGNFLEEVQEHSTSVGKVSHKHMQKYTQMHELVLQKYSICVSTLLFLRVFCIFLYDLFVVLHSTGVADHPVYLPYPGTWDSC